MLDEWIHVAPKLLQSNRPQAKILLKSDSNCLLINFFGPISTVRFNCRNDSIRIWTQISNPNSNYIQNWWILIKNC